MDSLLRRTIAIERSDTQIFVVAQPGLQFFFAGSGRSRIHQASATFLRTANALRGAPKLGDFVQNAMRDLNLGQLWQRLFAPFSMENRNDIGVVIEARAGSRDVVGHDQIRGLLRQLAPGVFGHLLGFGREADENRSPFRRETSARISAVGSNSIVRRPDPRFNLLG